MSEIKHYYDMPLEELFLCADPSPVLIILDPQLLTAQTMHHLIGKTTSGDGLMKEADLFYSFPLKQDGFFNIDLEARQRAETEDT